MKPTSPPRDPGPLVDRIERARVRLRGIVRETPLEPSHGLSRDLGRTALLKLECLQHTGSFKFRGASNILLGLDPEARARGAVAASTGNHALATARAALLAGVPLRVYVPSTLTPTKRTLLEAAGVETVFCGSDPLATELEARRVAEECGATYVSPYNDPRILAGQGTVGAEILARCPEVGTVYVSVGGGGLISGIAAFLKAHRPGVEVVGCLPEQSPVMSRSVAAGRVLEMTTHPTLSDGTAGGLESDSITFPVCQRLVDRWIEVPESAIADAMRRLFRQDRLVVEGAAGVAVAGALADGGARNPGPAVMVLCGRNVDMDRFQEILVGDGSGPPRGPGAGTEPGSLSTG